MWQLSIMWSIVTIQLTLCLEIKVHRVQTGVVDGHMKEGWQ